MIVLGSGPGADLLRACFVGDLQKGIGAISKGADVNATNSDGPGTGMMCQTLLYHACRRGHADIVRLLLENGADPNAFVDIGPPTNIGFPEESTPLCWCKGNLEIVELLLDHGADPMLPKDEPAIFYAGKRDANPKIVQRMLEAGANPNVGTVYGSILQLACVVENAKVVEVLLKWNAEPTIMTRDPPDCYWLSTYNIPILTMLLGAGADATTSLCGINMTLIDSAEKRLGLVSLLLEHGADVNFHPTGESSVGAALANADPVKAKWLLANGADRNATYKGAHISSLTDDPEIVSLLNPRVKRAE